MFLHGFEKHSFSFIESLKMKVTEPPILSGPMETPFQNQVEHTSVNTEQKHNLG